MTALLTRSVAAALEVVGDGRTVVGLVAPYNSPTVVDDGHGPYTEVIDRGAFAKLIGAGHARYVRLHLEHDGPWIGRGERWLDSDQGLSMAFRIDDSERGREASFKLSDEQVPGLSVAYQPGRTVTRDSREHGKVVHRQTVKCLHHVALVPQGAYPEAQVSAVRHASADRLSLFEAWLTDQRSQ
jgi:HK97 family phage prohead protease